MPTLKNPAVKVLSGEIRKSDSSSTWREDPLLNMERAEEPGACRQSGRRMANTREKIGSSMIECEEGNLCLACFDISSSSSSSTNWYL